MPVIRNSLGFADWVDEHTFERATIVYALTDGSSVKIGKSTGHPIRRLKSLSTGNPRPLRLLAYTAGTTESAVHKQLHRYRTRGEWFSISGELLATLRSWDWVYTSLLEDLSRDKRDDV